MATFSGFAAEAALGRFHRAQRLQLDLKLGQPDHSEYFIFFYWSFGDLKLCTHVRENQSNDGVLCCCWVTKSYLTLWPHELQHARFPCPSLFPGVCSNSCSLSQWCYLTISSSVIHYSSCLQSFLASESFPVNQLFESGGQSIRALASASVLPMNIQS